MKGNPSFHDMGRQDIREVGRRRVGKWGEMIAGDGT